MVSKGKSVTVGWFEIPVRDMDRAIQFYSHVFDVALEKQDFGGLLMAWFPWDASGKGAGGSLIQDENYVPSYEGTLIYFSSVDVETEINRVEEAGGKVLQERTEISPDIGFMGLFEDSEGNRIAVHSQK
jgi:predicted enzyme related to lactoylglutathione lyase